MVEGTSVGTSVPTTGKLCPRRIRTDRQPKTARRWVPQHTIDRIKRLVEAGYSDEQIAIRVKRNPSVVGKIRRRGFVAQLRDKMPIPGDFAFFAMKETLAQLGERYGCGRRQIEVYIQRSGVKRPDMAHRQPMKECPPDFAEIAPTLTQREAMKHWGLGAKLVAKFKRMHGIPTPVADREARKKGLIPPPLGWVERYVAERRG